MLRSFLVGKPRIALLRALIFSCAAYCFGCEPLDTTNPTSDGGLVDAGPPRAIFELPREQSGSFFNLPWPSDLRRTAEGTIDVASFPNPRNNRLVRRYMDAATTRLRGFATNGSVYFRFSHDIDLSSLPADPSQTLEDDASVFIIDLEASSETRLQRHPAVIAVEERATLFWPGHTLAVRPVYGIPLLGGHRYAAVVRRSVRPMMGGEFGRDSDLEALIDGGGDAAVDAARTLHQEAFDAIAEAGVPKEEILSIAVFTTQDPVAELALYRDWMHSNYDAPTPAESAWQRTSRSGFEEITGEYGPVPIFQAGEIPYESEGGAMDPGPDGQPVVHGSYQARFALTLPPSSVPMPEGGYPLVLYAHGTGGDFRSFIDDGTGPALAERGIATLGVDLIHHGDRNPTSLSPDILFFNLRNPDAARDNNRQSALDFVQLARLVPNLVIPTSISSRDGEAIHFDPAHVMFFGHSQGGLVAPLLLGIDDGVNAAVISAGSAVIAYALLEKLEPLSIPDVLRLALQLPGGGVSEAFEAEGMSFEHPLITLIQSWIESSDGSNFGHLAFASPREGFAPKSVLSTEGLMDTYSPPGGIEALAISMRVPPVQPVVRPIGAYDLLDIGAVSGAVQNNVASGHATAGLLQFANNGHFAVFENRSAQSRVRGFLESAAMGTPVIPAP
jgi:pimeloyl-ACP methyl ester carboxylesterase